MTSLTKTVINRLQAFFGVGYKRGKNVQVKDKIYPAKINKMPSGDYKLTKEKLPPHLQTLWDYWITGCHDSPADYDNMKKIYEDMDLLYYNSPLMARAMKLYASETIQADSNTKIIGIEAKGPQKKVIQEFIDKVGIEYLLEDTALNIVQYGNAGWILSLDDTGVDEVLPINIYDLEDRIEFTPHEVKKEMQKGKSVLAQMANQMERIQQLVQSVEDLESYTSYFRSYLFGFQVGKVVIPPWRFLHFRNFTARSPFFPYGIPIFMHAIAPYRQYDAAQSLNIVARGAQFPIDKYSLTLPTAMSPSDKLDKALEFIMELDNSGLTTTKKEGIGVGERIITIDGLWDYTQVSPQFDIKAGYDDIEMLRDDMIISTGLPRSFLDPNAPAFGASGVSLMQQFKPFARAVYKIQSIILENVSQLIKIHMITTGKFALEDLDFRLTMPYPESQTDRDGISSQSDLLTLANDIIEAISEKLVGDRDALLPDELIQQIYTQILPYDAERIETWVKQAAKAREEAKANSEDEDMFENVKKALKDFGGYTSRKELIEETLHETLQKTTKEGVLGGEHYFSSTNASKDFDTKKLVEFKKDNLKKLEEIHLIDKE